MAVASGTPSGTVETCTFDADSSGWGVFLILAGAVPLGVRAGYLDADQVGRLWSLWPLILIGIGVGLILRRTRLAFLGGLIVAATFGLMVGGLLSVGSTGFAGGNCGGAGATKPSRNAHRDVRPDRFDRRPARTAAR